jgi:hypothetical protein
MASVTRTSADNEQAARGNQCTPLQPALAKSRCPIELPSPVPGGITAASATTRWLIALAKRDEAARGRSPAPPLAVMPRLGVKTYVDELDTPRNEWI